MEVNDIEGWEGKSWIDYERGSTLQSKLSLNCKYSIVVIIERTDYDFNNAIRSDNRLKVLLEVKETDKLGMGQIQEDICKNK